MGKSKVPPPGWGSDKGLFGRLRSRLFAKEYSTIRRAIALCASIAMVVGTAAYLSAHTTAAANEFGLGKSTVDIVEDNVPDKDGVTWGNDSKHVQLEIKNDGKNIASLVRASIIPIVKKTGSNEVMEGHFGPLGEPGSNNQLVLKDVTFHFASNWRDNWLYKDGYFIYRKVLKPGDRTDYLLKGVTINSPGPGESHPNPQEFYKDREIFIEVHADSLEPSAAAAAAWGVKVTGDVVSF